MTRNRLVGKLKLQIKVLIQFEGLDSAFTASEPFFYFFFFFVLSFVGLDVFRVINWDDFTGRALLFRRSSKVFGAVADDEWPSHLEK